MNKNGFSLIEFIFSLMLLSVISAICFKIVLLSTESLIASREGYNSIYNYLKLKNLFKKIIDDYDSQPLFIPPTIHNSIISFPDGSIKLLSQNPNLQIKNNTEAISLISLDILKSYKNKSSISLNDITACPILNKIYKNEFKLFLGIGIDGVSLFKGTSYRKKDCRIFNLDTVKSLNFINQKIIPYLIIPVKSDYLIYLDKKDNLRFISNFGDRNLENQPLLSNIKELKINKSIDKNYGIMKLNIQVKLKSFKEKEFEIISKTRKINYYHLLYNFL